MRSAPVIALAALAFAGCGDSGEKNAISKDQAVVFKYCLYGSVSAAQASGCATHVSPETLLARVLKERHPSNALRYAFGDLDKCRADSGPACEANLTVEEIQADFNALAAGEKPAP